MSDVVHYDCVADWLVKRRVKVQVLWGESDHVSLTYLKRGRWTHSMSQKFCKNNLGSDFACPDLSRKGNCEVITFRNH
jgi:hypothetical protein